MKHIWYGSMAVDLAKVCFSHSWLYSILASKKSALTHGPKEWSNKCSSFLRKTIAATTYQKIINMHFGIPDHILQTNKDTMYMLIVLLGILYFECFRVVAVDTSLFRTIQDVKPTTIDGNQQRHHGLQQQRPKRHQPSQDENVLDAIPTFYENALGEQRGTFEIMERQLL